MLAFTVGRTPYPALDYSRVKDIYVKARRIELSVESIRKQQQPRIIAHEGDFAASYEKLIDNVVLEDLRAAEVSAPASRNAEMKPAVRSFVPGTWAWGIRFETV